MTGFLENAGDLRHIAELCRGRAARDDQAAALGQTRTRELAHRAAAEEQPGRHIKTENTHVAASLKKGAERPPALRGYLICRRLSIQRQQYHYSKLRLQRKE